MAMATAWLGAAWVAGYLFIIYQQGATELDTPMTVFLATFVGVMAALAFGAAVMQRRNDQWAQVMLYAAAGGFVPAGILGLASVGLPLILVGLLALISAGPRRIPQSFGVAAGVLSAIAFVIGVALSIRIS
jgi:hypothetical protein